MRQSTKRSLRGLVEHIVALRARLRVRGQWSVRQALSAPEFRDAGMEVVGNASSQSVMTLMRNDVSEFDRRDLDYLVQLHNAVPEIVAYTELLEAQVLRMRGLLIQCRSTMEEAITLPDDRDGTPIPEAILDRLDDVIRETGRVHDEHEIPDFPEAPAQRRRAIRIPANH